LSEINSLPPRSEIPDKYKWDDKSVFADQAAWEQEFDAVSADLAKLDPFRDHLADSPQVLANALELAQQLQKRVGIVFVYAGFSQAVNTEDQNAGAMYGKVLGLAGKSGGALAFIDPEIIAIGPDKIKQWTQAEPRLKI
jgi:oligoendopeptidase F